MSIPQSLHSPSQLYWHKVQLQRSQIRTRELQMRDCIYRPCILLNTSSIKSRGHRIDDSDEEEEVSIEYIRFESQQQPSNRKIVSMRRLIPYYGNISKCKRCNLTRNACKCVNYDHGSTWCHDLCNLYREQRRSELLLAMTTTENLKKSSTELLRHSSREIELQVDAELLFLEGLVSTQLHQDDDTLLSTKENCYKEVKRGKSKHPRLSSDDESTNTAPAIRSNLQGKHNAGKSVKALSSSESDLSHADDSSCDDEPYTQALSNMSTSADSLLLDSDDEREKNRLFFNPTSPERKLNQTNITKKKEPIRPGDIISYYHPIYRWGDVRGKRTAKVLSVDPRRIPILVLDNGEILPEDTKVQRIKILFTRIVKNRGEGGKWKEEKETVLIDHPGVFRCIEDFKLKVRNGRVGVEAGLQAECKRIKSIVQKNSMSTENESRLLARCLESSPSSSSSSSSSSSCSSDHSSFTLLSNSASRNISSHTSTVRHDHMKKAISSPVSSSSNTSQCLSSSKRAKIVSSPRITIQPFSLKFHPCKRPKTNPITFDRKQESSESSSDVSDYS